MTNPVSLQELSSFFAAIVQTLERQQIPYMVAGGFAAIFYGEPRLTIDIDIVTEVKLVHVQPLLEAFPAPDYYLSEDAMRDAIRRGYPFNITSTPIGWWPTGTRCPAGSRWITPARCSPPPTPSTLC